MFRVTQAVCCLWVVAMLSARACRHAVSKPWRTPSSQLTPSQSRSPVDTCTAAAAATTTTPDDPCLVCPRHHQNYQDVIQDVLRIIAYSMEAHNWELVRWFLGEHGSPDLGAYFLPIIAQVRTGQGPTSHPPTVTHRIGSRQPGYSVTGHQHRTACAPSRTRTAAQ